MTEPMDIDAIVERAVLAERERCAKIAETRIVKGKYKSQGVAHAAGHVIALAIRSQAPSHHTDTNTGAKG